MCAFDEEIIEKIRQWRLISSFKAKRFQSNPFFSSISLSPDRNEQSQITEWPTYFTFRRHSTSHQRHRDALISSFLRSVLIPRQTLLKLWNQQLHILLNNYRTWGPSSTEDSINSACTYYLKNGDCFIKFSIIWEIFKIFLSSTVHLKNIYNPEKLNYMNFQRQNLA